MTDAMTYSYLFYIGVLVPTVITIILFISFLLCWFKFNLREKIIKKKHNPHHLGEADCSIKPKSKPGVQRSAVKESGQIQRQNGQVIYSTHYDNGLSELNEAHYRFDRPNSQASTDSGDSGFRSSKSILCLPNPKTEQKHPQDIPLLRPVSSNRSDTHRCFAITNKGCYREEESKLEVHIPTRTVENSLTLSGSKFFPQTAKNSPKMLKDDNKQTVSAFIHKSSKEFDSQLSFSVV